MSQTCLRKACLLASAIALAPAAHADPLSFGDAVAHAASDSPTVAARADAYDAARHSITPAGSLPDPQLVLGVQNVPIEGPDRYRLDRDQMTMQSVGIMQDMRSFAALGAERAQARAQAERAEANLGVARIDAELNAARAWINTYYAERRSEILARLGQEAHAQARAARARLSSGGGSVDDAIAAEIDAARLDDRAADANAAVTAGRAELRRWIGVDADEALALDAPTFVIDADHLRDHLEHHPALAAAQADQSIAAANLRAAQADQVPDWSWQAMYQHRDASFGDMASVEVRIGLPLFQHWRQGPLVDARRADEASAEASRDATLREHVSMLESSLAEYTATQANLVRSRETRLPLAHQRAEAATASFAAGTINAAQVIAARRDALEAELDVIDLEERQALIGASLTLQYAEPTP